MATRTTTVDRILAVGLVAVVLRAFGPDLSFGFTDTDMLANVVCAGRPLAEQLSTPLTCGWGGDNANFWRPAATLLYAAQRAAFGWSAPGWHGVSIALHLTASFLLVRLAMRGGAGRALAWAVGALFAAHPLAVEIVPALARQLELSFVVGALAVLLAPGRVWFWPSLALALGSKEAAVVLLPALAVWAGGSTPWRPLLGVVLVWLAARAGVLGGVGGYGTQPELRALWVGMGELIFPSFGSWAQGGTWRVPALAAAAWAVVAGLAWLAGRGPARRLALLGWVLCVAPLLLLDLAGTYSRRQLYLPTAGLLLLVAAAMTRLPPRRQPVAAVAALMLGGAWLHGTPLRSSYTDWAQASRATEPFLHSELWADVPNGSAVWLVDRPSRVDVDFRRRRFQSGGHTLNHAAATYSIEAWVRETTGKDIAVRQLSSLTLGIPSSAWADVSREGDILRVSRFGVRRQLSSSSPHPLVDDGPTLQITSTAPLLVWQPTRAEWR